MLTLERPQDAHLEEREVARSIRVRVRPNGPLVDLPPGKTTVGSSPRCNIRIQQPGVQPLHCLILREADGLSVRRWAGETLLNGQRLEESSLGPGDCLQVGPAELEIVRPQAASPSGTPSVVLPVAPMVAAPAPTIPPMPEQANTSRLQAGRDLARSRARQMLAALRERRDSDRGLQQRVADLERQLERAGADRNDVASQLQNVMSELVAARRQTAEQQASSVANQELVAQNEELNRQVSVLTQRIEQLASEQSASSVAHRAIVDEKELLAAEGRRLADESCNLREQLQQHADRYSKLSVERDEARGQSESLRLELHSLAEREAVAVGNAGRLEHELAQLQQRAAEHINQVAIACGERDEAWRQCESLRAEVRVLCERESLFAHNVGRLEHENAQFQVRGAELSNQISGVNGERDEAWRQCESLRSEVLARNEREAALVQNISQLNHENTELQAHRAELLSQIGALRDERDELRPANEQLRSEVKDLAQERGALADEHAASNRERESLRQQLQAAVDEEALRACERAELVAECQRLREESDRLPQLEQHIRDAVADRENTSSELYRALLQLAEMQERDDHSVALAAAHSALNAELEKSMQDIATLQSQIDRLSEDRIKADETRQSLDRRTAELIEAHQQLAYDKTALTIELAELREQLEVASRWEAESAAQLETAETWRQRLEVTEQNHSELVETVARLRGELAGKVQPEAAAAAAIADRERQIAEYDQLLAESGEAVRMLEKKLAMAVESTDQFEQLSNEWRRESKEALRQQSQFSQRIADLESQLQEAEAAASEAAEIASQALVEKQTSLDADVVQETETLGEPSKPAVAPNELPTSAVDRQPSKTQSDSFIERYSHLLSEDAGADESLSTPPVAAPRVEQNSTRKPLSGSVVRPSGSSPLSARENDEESIEDYMAKLLQRVRGDSPANTATAAASPLQSSERMMPMSTPVGFSTAPLTAPPSMVGGDLQSPLGFDPLKRRSSMPAPKTDLEALRALANESARRAISRHALRKHRRNAMTKVIVSTLAGMTSLWLMLDSDNWLNLQFITACVAMLIAAYWAGETLRAWLESLRIAATDEIDAEIDAEIQDLSTELRTPLPIDVE